MLIHLEQITSVLDYGAGKGALGQLLQDYDPALSIQNYDPAVPDYADLPARAALLICNDVLEHVEPEYLDAVLDHMTSLMGQVGFLVIALRKSNKRLPDGRNAHLIVADADWWLERLGKRWAVERLPSRRDKELCVIVRPK